MSRPSQAAHWLSGYRAGDLRADLLAGLILAALLVPQALAYGLLAGLPPAYGLYAALLPPLAYALLGSGRLLAVGPVAVIAVMTGHALAPYAAAPSSLLPAAALLSALVGILLLLLGALRAGVLVNFVSQPVLSGFMSGAALLIIGSQLAGLGLPLHGLGDWTPARLAPGLLALALLLAVRWPPLAGRLGGSARLLPLLLLLAGIAVERIWQFDLPRVGRFLVGLPTPQLPHWDWRQAGALLPSALAIALVAYIESVLLSQSLARRQRRRIVPDREALAVGLGNLGSALLGGIPVAGSLSRSAVAFESGARSPLAGVFAAVLAALAAVFAGELLAAVPRALLAAIVVAAAWRLIELRALVDVWRYDRAEGAAAVVTILGVVALGPEEGLLLGVVLALLSHVWRAARPPVAELGRVPRSEQFRELQRDPDLETWPQLLILRVDESLFFGNADAVAGFVAARLAARPGVDEVILACGAVNRLDFSALAMLERLEQDLSGAGVTLHLAELKGEPLDRLENSALVGRIGFYRLHASIAAAIEALASPPI
jgi:Sulfate permease and related transporters (MFS superfamily)